ncbi:hypothetical protein WDW89_12680 [Deltaproteobacteria bacterium TL4]
MSKHQNLNPYAPQKTSNTQKSSPQKPSSSGSLQDQLQAIHPIIKPSEDVNKPQFSQGDVLAQELEQQQLEISWMQDLNSVLDDEQKVDEMHKLAKKASQNSLSQTQIKQLENVAWSARSYSEIFDFIYRQMAKHQRDWGEFGKELENILQQLKQQAHEIGKKYWTQETLPHRLKKQESVLILLRGMIGHCAARFGYEQATNSQHSNHRSH